MSRPIGNSCRRCVIGNARGGSGNCEACNRAIDRIIERALDGYVSDEELAGDLGLTIDALTKRRKRLLARLHRAEVSV